MTRRVFSLLALLVFLPASAVAQDAFRWIDAQGNTVYGTKPPKNARNVTKIKTHNLSRYSSDKVLKRLGWEGERAEPPAAPAARAGDQKSSAAKAGVPFNAGPAELAAGEVLISTNEDGAITSCSVKVQNKGTGNAEEVSVAFEFPDQTLVPAAGPDQIEAGGDASFSIPEDLLPITLKLPESEEGAEVSRTPRVIVHGAKR